jgi:hypothetical protein
MPRMTLKTLSIAIGAVLAVLFLASIVSDLVIADERCDECGEVMEYDYAQPGVNAVLVIFRCHKCDQRGQRAYLDDGRIEWTEW